MQPFKQLSHLYSMRKLFFILLFFSFGNSFAQGKVNGVINLARLILVEPNYAVRINVSDFYIIQPEISYRFATMKGSYELGEYYTWHEVLLMLKNQYKFNSVMFALTQGIKTLPKKRVDITAFYRLEYNNDMGYYDYGCGYSSSCPITYYSGGGLKINKYGIKLLINEELKSGLEVYSGFSVSKREMIISYKKYYSAYTESSESHSKMQKNVSSRILPAIHLGLNVIL